MDRFNANEDSPEWAKEKTMSAQWSEEVLKMANVALYERFDHLPAEHADAQVLQCEATALREALEDALPHLEYKRTHTQTQEGRRNVARVIEQAKELLTRIPK